MRVLFVTRPTVLSGPGGDTIQLFKTAEYLRKLDVDVEIASSSAPDYSGFDLVHFFNLRNPQDLLSNVRRAKRDSVPSALSTIWGSYYECDVRARKGLFRAASVALGESRIEYAKVVARALFNGNFNRRMIPYFLKGHLGSQREIARLVDVLLPNSPTELERVMSDMKSPDKAGVVVVNAADTEIFDYENVEVSPKYEDLEGSIVCAARIEVRKCQLELIHAVRSTPYKLVLIGKPSPNSRAYYEACLESAGENVRFISHVSQPELAQIYRQAKVHALVSWMETPGLSSLEAALMKCNLVVTSKGDTKYYFSDMVEYVEPDDVSSIREGLNRAMSKPSSDRLRSHVAENFNWEKTAASTLRGYRIATNQL